MLPTNDRVHHGYSPKELNSHFSSISVSSLEDPNESYNTISSESPDRVSFHLVTVNDVIWAVAHFKSQVRCKDVILHSIVAKALPGTALHRVELFSVSLAPGVFPSSWKKACLIALKKVSTPFLSI